MKNREDKGLDATANPITMGVTTHEVMQPYKPWCNGTGHMASGSEARWTNSEVE